MLCSNAMGFLYIRQVMVTARKSLKILVAEDDELVGGLLAEILISMGHEVCPVEASEAG